MKPTRMWHLGTMEQWIPKPMCSKRRPCKHVVDGRHPQTAQMGRERYQAGILHRNDFTQIDLYRIPPALIHAWVDSFASDAFE